jgi:hypothetical protein
MEENGVEITELKSHKKILENATKRTREFRSR